MGLVHTKNFWKRPEGKLGVAIILLMLLVLCVFYRQIGAFLYDVLTPFATMIILVVITGFIIYILVDKRGMNLVCYSFSGLMKKILSFFVETDPIKILDKYVVYLKNSLSGLDKHLIKLKAERNKIDRLMTTNVAEMERVLNLSLKARQTGNKDVEILNSRQYGRLKELNTKYEKFIQQIDHLYEILNKTYNASLFLVKDTENEVRLRKQEQRAVLEGYSAMKYAANLINGQPDRKQLFDEANQELADNFCTKVAEIERFVEVTNSFIDNMDVQNALYEQQGFDEIERLEKKVAVSTAV